jgi:NADPH:quinone reductase-like Zn-dependent oxidoreductase
MQAILTDPNAPAGLALRSIAVPEQAPHMALVRVKAVSLNLGEVRRASISPGGTRIGWDLAGMVERSAADGSGPPVGTRVVGFVATGAWAEIVAVPTNALARLPDRVSFAQAATLPVAGLTALHAVEQNGSLLARNVLITGASGGVGLFACQLAYLMGARVVAVIRQPHYEVLVHTAGAHAVVISEDGADARQFGPYHLFADGVGGQVLANAISMLGPDGLGVLYGTAAESEFRFNLWPFLGAGRARLYGLVLFNELAREPAADGLTRLVQLMADGRLHPHIDIEESWTEIGIVAQRLLDRKVAGKAVLHID